MSLHVAAAFGGLVIQHLHNLVGHILIDLLIASTIVLLRLAAAVAASSFLGFLAASVLFGQSSLSLPFSSLLSLCSFLRSGPLLGGFGSLSSGSQLLLLESSFLSLLRFHLLSLFSCHHGLLSPQHLLSLLLGGLTSSLCELSLPIKCSLFSQLGGPSSSQDSLSPLGSSGSPPERLLLLLLSSGLRLGSHLTLLLLLSGPASSCSLSLGGGGLSFSCGTLLFLGKSSCLLSSGGSSSAPGKGRSTRLSEMSNACKLCSSFGSESGSVSSHSSEVGHTSCMLSTSDQVSAAEPCSSTSDGSLSSDTGEADASSVSSSMSNQSHSSSVGTNAGDSSSSKHS